MTLPHFPDLVRHTFLTTPTLPPLTTQAYQYMVAQNGVFLHAQNRFLTAVVPVAPAHNAIRGLHPLHLPAVQLHVPRLPIHLLQTATRHARQQRDMAGRWQEALYRFHHDGSQVRLVCPPQQATSTSVHTITPDTPDILLELHSHGSLRAFWSTTDDADERGFRFYGVLGRLDAPQVEVRLRLGVYGTFLPVPLPTLFDL